MKKLLQKYKNLPLTLKASFWFIFALLLQKGINIITTPIFTRIMTQEAYGTYSLFNTWYNIFLVVCTFNLFGGIFNTIIHKNQENRDEITSSVLGFEIFLTIIVFVLYIGYHFLFGNLQGLNFSLSLLVFLQILVNIPTSIWIAKCKYEYNYFACALTIIIQSLVLTLLSVLAVVFIEQKVYARVVSNIIVAGIVSVFIAILLIRKSKNLFNKKNWKYLFILGAPLVFHYLAQDIMSQSDQIIIDIYFGSETVAVYSLAHQLSMIFTILTTAVNTTFVPWVYRRIDENRGDTVRGISLLIFLFICCVTLCVSLISPEIIFLFGGKTYSEGAKLVPILISNVILITGYDLFSHVEFYYSKTLIASLITVFCAAINIGLNIVFIPKYSMTAACYTTLVSYFVMMFIHFFVMKYYIKKNGLKNLFNYKLIWLFSAIFISANLLTMFILENLILRYIILALLLILLSLIIILNRNRIKSFIKKDS